MSEESNPMVENRSMFRDFVASISTMRGDLSNITAPPFVLDTKSTVELPSYWSERPAIFCAPAHSDDPAERALLVLKWFLSSLKNQNYMGHKEEEGVKKPLNAFLGELFLARWEDEMGTTRLVSEQVSHHPPITACRVWNDEHGVSASGYTRQTITFNGSVSIKQTGHALFTLSKRNESYLIPLPELKVKGVLTGSLYPELSGKYYMPSTSGYMSVIDFSGKGWFGSGCKHGLEARVYKIEDGEEDPIYTLKGTWNKEFVIHDARKGEDIEVFDIVTQSTKFTKLIVEPLDEQDPWETRRAWRGVISALNRGDMKGTTEAKSKVEQGQRKMREDEKREGREWRQRFFSIRAGDETAELLTNMIPGSSSLDSEKKETKGVWAFDIEKWEQGIAKPYHDEMCPDNSHKIYDTVESGARSSTESVGSVAGSQVSTPQERRTPIDGSPFTSPRNSSDSFQRPLTQEKEGRRFSGSFRFPFRKSTEQRRSVDLSRPMSPRDSVSTQNSLASVSDSIKSIPKDTPQPQAEQAFKSENERRGSGIDGMSLSEKLSVEQMLRDEYATGKPRQHNRKSRLSIDMGQ